MRKVSVIIPTYNRESTILKSVYSVLNQSYKEIEVIIVDDGSTDTTLKKLKNINDERLKVVTQNHLGACIARNKGICESKGYYIAFQDSDDYWYPDKLEKQVVDLEKNDSDINFCKMITKSDQQDDYITPDFEINKSFKYTERLLISNFISTQTILIKTSVAKRYDFDAELPRFQDWDWVLNISKRYTISYTDKILVQQNISKDSISKNIAKADAAYRIIEKKYSNLYAKNKKAHSKFLYNWAIHCSKYLSPLDRRDLLIKSLKLSFSIKNLYRIIQTFQQ